MAGNRPRKRVPDKKRDPVTESVAELAEARQRRGKPLSADEWRKWHNLGVNIPNVWSRPSRRKGDKK